MDDLRWILATIGAVVVVATYLSSRFEREEWRRDREHGKGQPQSENFERIEPQIGIFTQVKKVSVGLSGEDDVKKALAEPEQDPSPSEEKTKTSESERDNVAGSVVDPVEELLVEDEIVSVQIPAEFSEYAEERRSASRLKFKTESEKPFQQELVLDVEPLVLALTILAKDENLFSGSEVKKALEHEGINHGDMKIFHFRMGDEKDAVFSVASVVEPGIFDLKTIDENKTPGLSLFCQLPGPVAGTVAFELMLKKAQIITDKLGGQLCDDKRNLLTEQATGHYRDRIMVFDHEVALARKKQE
jgi:cell division protein ZipA